MNSIVKKLNTIHNINKTMKYLGVNLMKNGEDLQRTFRDSLFSVRLNPKFFKYNGEKNLNSKKT